MNPEKQREYWMKSVYGITAAEWDAFLDRQHGVCPICRTTPERWTVDHDHSTGAVRGLLCGSCNLGIGHLGDDVERLRRAVRYLSKH